MLYGMVWTHHELVVLLALARRRPHVAVVVVVVAAAGVVLPLERARVGNRPLVVVLCGMEGAAARVAQCTTHNESQRITLQLTDERCVSGWAGTRPGRASSQPSGVSPVVSTVVILRGSAQLDTGKGCDGWGPSREAPTAPRHGRAPAAKEGRRPPRETQYKSKTNKQHIKCVNTL